MNPRARDRAGGALVALTGLGATVVGSSYPLGSLNRMGPGFFPVSLGVILTVTGLLIALSAKASGPPGAHGPMAPDLRGWACILAGVAAFAVLGQRAGLVPATFAVVFISAMGDRRNSLGAAAMLALVMVVVCVVVFVWLLNIPFNLFGAAG